MAHLSVFCYSSIAKVDEKATHVRSWRFLQQLDKGPNLGKIAPFILKWEKSVCYESKLEIHWHLEGIKHKKSDGVSGIMGIWTNDQILQGSDTMSGVSTWVSPRRSHIHNLVIDVLIKIKLQCMVPKPSQE